MCSLVEHFYSDSEEFSESGFSHDEFNLNEAVNGGVVSEEFLLNQVGKRLEECFQNEFDSFMGRLPPVIYRSRRLKRKVQHDYYTSLIVE